MNILPKKRWHVRTKENIARVRRDEAQAAAEEKEQERRALLAEQEFRTNALRDKARSRFKGNLTDEPEENVCVDGKYEHVNLFQDVEDGQVVTNKTNADYEREQKEEKEKYEKQIGYLTYLGQDTVEATGNISWYNKIPEKVSKTKDNSEVDIKSKSLADPLITMKKFLPPSEYIRSCSLKSTAPTSTVAKLEKMNFCQRGSQKSNQHRKHKDKKRHRFKHIKKCKRRRNYSSESSDDSDASQGKQCSKRSKNEGGSSASSSETCGSSDSTDSCEDMQKRCKVNMEQLRAERLKREREEQLRTQALLAKIRGQPSPLPQSEKDNQAPTVMQKYNSQFNPELARQNFQHVSS